MNCGCILISLKSGKKAGFGLLTEEIWGSTEYSSNIYKLSRPFREYLLHGSPQDLFIYFVTFGVCFSRYDTQFFRWFSVDVCLWYKRSVSIALAY